MKLTKYISKKLLANSKVKKVISWLAYKYISFVYYSTKWEIIAPENMNLDLLSGKPVIYAFWHGRLMLMSPYLAPVYNKINVLSSGHRDGDLMSNITKYFNFNTIYGTRKKNSISATREILRKLQKGESLAITPDGGQRGPRMHIKSNIINIARISGTIIVPITYSISKCHIINSWDKFILAFPYGKGVIIYGDPIVVPKNLSSEEENSYTLQLEEKLNKISFEADSLVNIDPIMPA
ncbi:MAG: lysophospholipid acyltransferase family protein [Alphaproteobacteria bacterium]